MLKIITVIGARPQFIKAATVSRIIKNHNGIREIILHTGQHYDKKMSDIFFKDLGISDPDYNLNINSSTHGDMTGRMLQGIESVLISEKPDWILVYGDTNSTLAGSLAASKLHIPVAHIEAGLRSYNKKMPEEVNRILTDHVSDLLFCPTETSITNLANEGILEGVIHAGDVMYDAVIYIKRKKMFNNELLERHGLSRNEYSLVTIHRAENTDDAERLREIINYLNEITECRKVVMPLHPRTAIALKHHNISTGNITIIEPVGYIEMAGLIESCYNVITDSGGLQKEAYFHGKRCITLRDETEWIETIESGWNRLWKDREYKPRKKIKDYGDGDAASKIIKTIINY